MSTSLLGEPCRNLGLVHRARISSDLRAPLVFLFHGKGGTCASMAPFVRAVPKEWSIIAPEGAIDDPVLGGKAWWVHQQSSYGEKLHIAKQTLSFCNEAISAYGLSPLSTIACGFSMGAFLLSLACALEECSFSGVAFLAGGRIISQDGPPLRLRGGLRIFFAHGTDDEIVSIEGARTWAAELRDEGHDVCFVEDRVGHKVGSRGMRALSQWIRSAAPLFIAGLELPE